MTSRLAIDDIVISHGGNTVRLRPSLRAGLLIAQKYSLEDLQTALGECNFTVISHLIALGSNDLERTTDLIAGFLAKGYWQLQTIRPQLAAFVAGSLGLTREAPANDNSTDTTGETDFAASLIKLYEVGTGWLGWTPADTWAATPAEIIAAQRGLFAKLKAIYGSADDQPADDPHDVPDEAQVKANMAALKAKLGSKL